VSIVDRLGIDGLRVDAPTYNQFADWAPDREGRASYGPMASLPLLRELRARLRAIDPEFVVYTEPTGGLFRSVADATYNYDEHWLIESLLAEPHPRKDQLLVRNARDMQRWLRDRAAALPPGSTIVHHVDSHDSIWWRLPGAQWRRERFGLEATTALIAGLSLAGGGFMTFMGGEEGVEEALRRAHDLRRRLPEIATGTVDYEAAIASSDDVLVVLRSLADTTAVVAVNLTASPVTCEIQIDGVVVAGKVWDHWNEGKVWDYWNDELLDVAGGDRLQVDFRPFQPRVFRIEPGPAQPAG